MSLAISLPAWPEDPTEGMSAAKAGEVARKIIWKQMNAARKRFLIRDIMEEGPPRFSSVIIPWAHPVNTRGREDDSP
jgi:hypothetical protein